MNTWELEFTDDTPKTRYETPQYNLRADIEGVVISTYSTDLEVRERQSVVIVPWHRLKQFSAFFLEKK